MSTLGLVLVILGIAIVVTRVPFVLAPEGMRSFALRMIGSEGRMRAFGFLVAFLGIILTWAGGTASGLVAQVIFVIGFAWLLAGVLFMIPFPARAVSLATGVLGRMSTGTLRIGGAVVVLLGAVIALYGYSL